MFAIAWQYLLGRAVATDVTDRRVAEWPPHPDRLFQALVAAWGERGEDPGERAALEWLESLPPPSLATPEAAKAANPKVYVPVNDTSGKRGAYGENQLGLLPSKRARKERYFPATLPGDATIACIWRDAVAASHSAALERLANAVTYLGHSSSLVRAWCEPAPPAPTLRPAAPGEPVADQLRVPVPGRLAHLCQCFAGGGSDWRRAGRGAWRAYTRCNQHNLPCGEFSERMIVLRRVGGAPWLLSQTLHVARALRSTLLPHLEGRALALVSGHAADGSPLREPHVACLPLGFVGHRHADGHLLGVALAFPGTATYAEEDAVFEALATVIDPDSDSFALRLAGGRETWLALEVRAAPPLTLRPETWCTASRTWTTVTPVALDRHPPRRHPDRDGYVIERIQNELFRQGLPRAAEVALIPTSTLDGVPAAHDFPGIEIHSGRRRRHTHVWLRLGEHVRGPLVLGAGRYRGYGLFKPTREECI